MLLEPLDFFKVLFLLSHFNFPYLKAQGEEERGCQGFQSGLSSGCCSQRGLFFNPLVGGKISTFWLQVYFV